MSWHGLPKNFWLGLGALVDLLGRPSHELLAGLGGPCILCSYAVLCFALLCSALRCPAWLVFAFMSFFAVLVFESLCATSVLPCSASLLLCLALHYVALHCFWFDVVLICNALLCIAFLFAIYVEYWDGMCVDPMR